MSSRGPLEQLHIWHIYAANPDYLPVPADGEGCSCVDDVARIAVFFLRQYRNQPDLAYLERARAGVEFVLRMQAPDGEFYNFVFPDGIINQDGPTSYKSLGWWAARAVWCMGTAVAAFRDVDHEFAALVRSRLGITVRRMLAYLKEREGQYRCLEGVQLPGWFPEHSADAAASAVLGLCELFEATGDQDAQEVIRRCCAGFLGMEQGTPEDFPFRAHLNSADAMYRWHSWGNSQVMALARAGQLLGEPEWVSSAERAANGMLARLLASWGPASGMYPDPRIFQQIAYNVEMIAGGLLALHRATGKDLYARLAGIAASWLFGNNPAGTEVYDPTTGRCLDGIDGPDAVNPHSGAESTVCALLALADLVDVPLAHPYLDLRADRFGLEQVVDAGSALALAGQPRIGGTDGHRLRLRPGGRVRLAVQAHEAGDHVLHLVYERQPAPGALVGVRLDGGRTVYHWHGGAADGPHPWMAHVGVFEELAAGEHSLEVEGIHGSARITALVFHPAVLAKELCSSDGRGASSQASSASPTSLTKALAGRERRVLLLKNLRRRPALVPVSVGGRPTVLGYDAEANPVRSAAILSRDGLALAPVARFGTTLVEE